MKDQVIQIDEARIRDHFGEMVRGTVEEALNVMLDAKIDEWRHRRIEGDHPYLYFDGIVMKRNWAGEVRNVSLLLASAVNTEGYREILGICEGAKEDKSGWSAFLRHLVDRGLSGVKLETRINLPFSALI
jgi:transposase-like protein